MNAKERIESGAQAYETWAARFEGQVSRLEELQAAALSNEYPCPCWDFDTQVSCKNTVTLEWQAADSDDYYTTSQYSEPVFSGCEAHNDILNDDSPEAGYVVHEYYERKRWRTLLGIETK